MEPRTTEWLDGSRGSAPRGDDEPAPTKSEVPTVAGRAGSDTEPAGDRPTLVLGQTLGKYLIRQRLGRGGQAQAFLAFDPDLERDVVIKYYHSVQDPADREAVLREGRALARVTSPYVAQCYGADRHEGAPYLVLEYVPGETLSALVAREPLAPTRALRLAAHVAEGLAAIHGVGLLHLDLKPSNILVGRDDRPRIVDFGLAAPTGSERLRKISGTPAYMAPEQALGDVDAIGPRSDVFGLGAVLFELLAGRPPYRGDSSLDVWNQAKQGVVPALTTLQPKLAPAIAALCAKALAKRPDERWESADAFRQAAEQLERKERGGFGIAFRLGRFRLQFSIGISLASVLALFAGIAWMDRQSTRTGNELVAYHAPAGPKAAPGMGGVVGADATMMADARAALNSTGPAAIESQSPTAEPGPVGATDTKHKAAFELRRGNPTRDFASRADKTRSDFRLEATPIAPSQLREGVVETPVGEPFALRFAAERDCTVVVWWLQTDGSVVQLWPNGHEADSTLVAGESRELPPRAAGRRAYDLPASAAGDAGRLHVVARSAPLPEEFSANAAAPKDEPFRIWKRVDERRAFERAARELEERDAAEATRVERSEQVIPLRAGTTP